MTGAAPGEIIGERSEGAEEARVQLGSHRIPAVDGLRAVAVIAVILFHFRRSLVPGGFIGVDLFFVISGFVITRSLLDEHGRTGIVSFRDFYVRRVRRILPALLALTAILTVVAAYTGRLETTHLRSVLGALTSTLNWYYAWGGDRSSDLVHVWSLSVEEQFYIAWPLAFAAAARWDGRRGLLIVAGAAALVSAAVSLWLSWRGAPWYRCYFGSDARAQAILAGCLLAALRPNAVTAALSRLWPVAALAWGWMALTLDNRTATMGAGGFTAAALISAWLIAAAAHAPGGAWPRLLSARALQWTGLRSYSLFLWHYPLALAAHVLWPGLWAPIALAASLLAADLSFRFVERPFYRVGG